MKYSNDLFLTTCNDEESQQANQHSMFSGGVFSVELLIGHGQVAIAAGQC